MASTWSKRRKGFLRERLLNFDYVQRKLAATGANALIADYDHLAGEEPFRSKPPPGFRHVRARSIDGN